MTDIKVFLSHQKADSEIAHRVRDRFKYHHQIDCYLDVIDPHLGKAGDDLARHLQSEISKCSHLLAITSYHTKGSQWVPWEIGIATERRMPLATFANYVSSVPEFLEAWPYLRDLSDVDSYAQSAKTKRRYIGVNKSLNEQTEIRTSEFNSFYIDLRQRLGQRII